MKKLLALLLLVPFVGNAQPIIQRLNQLRDVRLNPTVSDGNALVYDETLGAWTNAPVQVGVDAVQAEVDDLKTGDQTISAQWNHYDLLSSRGVEFAHTNFTGTEFTFDLNGPRTAYWEVTGDWTLNLVPPTDTNSIDFHLRIVSNQSTSTLGTLPDSDDFRSEDDTYPVGVVANGWLNWFPHWDGTNLSFSWLGPQSGPLSTARGGRGLTNSNDRIVWSTAYGSPATNYDANSKDSDGVRQLKHRINSLTNIHIAGRGQPPANTNESAEMHFRTKNANTDPATNTLSFHTEWNLVGFSQSYGLDLTNGEYARFIVDPEGPANSDVWVYNQQATTTVLAGGGSPPATGLNAGLVAYFKFNETSGNAVSNALGGAITNLQFSSSGWNKNETGPDGNSWSNTLTTATSSNASAGLKLGQGADDGFTFAVWYRPVEKNSKYIMGRWFHSATEVNKKYAWSLQHDSTGNIDLWAANNTTGGTNTTASVQTTMNTTVGALNFVAAMFDDANNLIGVSHNGSAWQTSAFTGTIFDADIAFNLSGSYYTETWSGMRSQWADLGVWNRPLSDVEISSLYNSGTGKFPSDAGVFAD